MIHSNLDIMAEQSDAAFPCSMIINIPFPTARLASVALQALCVDKELSPSVRRHFSTTAAGDIDTAGKLILRTEYSATTNRMLRVAVNSFMDSIMLVLDVMENLDTDVLLQNNQNDLPG